MWLRVRVQSLGRMQETLQSFAPRCYQLGVSQIGGVQFMGSPQEGHEYLAVYVEVPRFKETTVTIFRGCRVY